MKNQIIAIMTIFIFLLSLANVSAVECSAYGNMDWSLENSYAISKSITIQPSIISSQSLTGLPIKMELQQKNIFDNNFQTIDQLIGRNILSGNTLPSLTFSGVNRREPIRFRLTVFDTSLQSGEVSFISEQVSIKDSLTISPSILPQIQNAGQEILIGLSITDNAGNTVTDPLTISVIILCGTDVITPTSVSQTAIKFKTNKVCSVLATITASGIDFAPATNSITFELIKADITQEVEVDGINHRNLDGGRISTGTKRLSVGVKKAGVLVKIDKVDLFMQRPDGGFDDLIFTPNFDKTKWTTSYNFLSEERTYTMGGNTNTGQPGRLSNFETGKDYDVSASFLTVGVGGDFCTLNPDDPSCKTIIEGIPIWVWIIAGVVALVIIGGIVIVVVRR